LRCVAAAPRHIALGRALWYASRLDCDDLRAGIKVTISAPLDSSFSPSFLKSYSLGGPTSPEMLEVNSQARIIKLPSSMTRNFCGIASHGYFWLSKNLSLSFVRVSDLFSVVA